MGGFVSHDARLRKRYRKGLTLSVCFLLECDGPNGWSLALSHFGSDRLIYYQAQIMVKHWILHEVASLGSMNIKYFVRREKYLTCKKSQVNTSQTSPQRPSKQAATFMLEEQTRLSRWHQPIKPVRSTEYMPSARL